MNNQLAVGTFAVLSRKKGPARAQARANLVHALKARAKQTRQPMQKLLDRHGVTRPRDLWLINGMALRATRALIEEMAVMPEVASIVLDQTIELPVSVNTQASVAFEPNIALVKAPELWALGYAGQGVTVAVVDTGVDINHPDLATKWRGGTNSWFDPHGEHPSMPTDRDGHGTQVTGLVLGGNHSGAYIGVAPDAEWIGVKIFADNGAATSSSIHAGFQWLLDPDGNPETDDAPDIVNNSWGFDDFPDICSTLSGEFRSDVQAMQAANIAVVFAAGNTGPDDSSSIAPANYPESFAVGSVGTFTSATLISSFSARGPSACDSTIYPELVAPGFELLTSDLTAGGVILDSYSMVTGTSFSTSHASGVMALLLSAYPDMPVATLEKALKQSASDLGPLGADNTYGYGLVDSLSAFNYLTGQQDIDVTDSISPERDHLVAFGSVPPDGNALASVRVRNTGSVPVSLDTTDVSNVREPFSISSDACSGKLLPAGEACTIGLRFAPTLPGNSSGSLTILSNAVHEERVTVTISGTGNTPPVAPRPLAPADGATVGTSVTFHWLPASDADGDSVAQFLVYSPHADFSFSTTREVEQVPTVVLASGIFLLGVLCVMAARRRRGMTASLIITTLLLLMVACGGGGGGSESVIEDQSTTVSGLASGVTYYWKMTARDSHGAETQSVVRTIHVQ
jgi:subtilisin family serine protease